MDKIFTLISALYTGMYDRDETEDRGAGIVEYGLLVAFIALLAVGGITALGGNLGDFFTDLAGNF